MSLLGLELSDAGIIAVGGTPQRLLEIDGVAKESPGFALPEKNQLAVGKAAEQKAHVFPRLVTSHFWDQLNTEPLDHPGPYTQRNHAEIAYSHMAQIWNQIQDHGTEIIVAVPGFYDQDQLGILLGIAKELGLPINGFIPIALAASSSPCPQKALFYLDMHLHRTEINLLDQGDHLTCQDSIIIAEKGLAHLYREWVVSIAAEFVRSTRFDPLHQARSEQELFDRLPTVLKQLHKHSSVDFEMSGGSRTYRVTLTRELFMKKSQPLFAEIGRVVEKKLAHHNQLPDGAAIQLSHRIARLPGLKESLAAMHPAQFIELDAGAAAMGSIQLWDQLSQQQSGQGISFFTSRPWQNIIQSEVLQASDANRQTRPPTHVLYRNLAYPLSETPLHIGLDIEAGKPCIRVEGQTSGVSRRHCTIELRGDEAVLVDFSSYGTFVDENRVNGSIALKLGHIIRVGTPGEQLQLIACLTTLFFRVEQLDET